MKVNGPVSEDMDKAIEKIEAAKTEPKSLKDTEWFDGFNSGLDWAIRILSKDKSAY